MTASDAAAPDAAAPDAAAPDAAAPAGTDRPAPDRPVPAWRLVAGKELGDLLGRIGRRPVTRTLAVVGVFGLLIPLRFSGTANLPAFFAVFTAFLPARLVAIDAYAGERERGTLEALLASPLSDRAIAVGKVAAATAYGVARGWLFLAVWLASAALLRATGLAPRARRCPPRPCSSPWSWPPSWSRSAPRCSASTSPRRPRRCGRSWRAAACCAWS